MTRHPAEVVAAMVVSLMREPCLLKMILLDAGMHPDKTNRIQKHMRALRAAGLVRVHSWAGDDPRYVWQSAPFALPDVPKETPTRPPRVERWKRPEVVVLPAAASVFEWGNT